MRIIGRSIIRKSAGALALSIAISCFGWVMAPAALADDGSTAANGSAADAAETVMVVGGSVAHGWADPTNDSYLRRGFAALGDATHVDYRYIDHSIPGSPAVAISSATFANWLGADKPDIVVISWGILDDIHANTPIADFQRTIRDEIAQSMSAHAAVLVVTPPVVPANAVDWHAQFEAYVSAEQQAVAAFASPNVHWINLNADMADYLARNNLAVGDYAVGGWHPNAAGHQLAGQLLAADMEHALGSSPVEFDRLSAASHQASARIVRGARHRATVDTRAARSRKAPASMAHAGV